MSGICVEKIGSVQIFLKEDGTYDGYDFATNKYIPDPYKDKPADYKPVRLRKSKEEMAKEVDAITEYQTLALPDRKLTKETLEYFNIKIGVSETDGETPEVHYYPYTQGGDIVGYKARVIESKQMWSIGDQKDVDLFGWQQAIAVGAKRLYITEGELDAASLYQIFKDHNKGTAYAAFNPSIVSLPHGAGSASRDISRCLKSIREHFKEVVLVFDNDVAGQKAIDDTMLVIPDAVVAKLPAKDANECLMQGRNKAAYNACTFNAQKPKNTRLVSGSSVVDAARKEAEWGFSYPYEGLTKLTRGQRLGECVYWGAGVKMGKSAFLDDLAAWNIKEHKWKVFVVKTEESNARTLQGVVGKMVGKIFHDPNIPFDFDAFDKGVPLVEDSLFMLNLYQELSWDVLKADIRQAANEGCKAIFIDPITTLSNAYNPADANTLLQKMSQELAQLAMDLQVVCHIYCHLKAPDQGPPHERGGAVQSQQFAGSRAMMRSCHAMIGICGNKDPNLPEEQRNIRELLLLEDRTTGSSGKTVVYYDNKTGLFNEIK
jgi:twinkle protein